MLVLLSLTRNRWSVPHTSNVCCGYGLPTFAYSPASGSIAPKPVIPAG